MPAYTFRATGTTATNGGTPGLPAGLQEDDLMLLFGRSRGADGTDWTVPSGYVALFDNGTAPRITIFGKTAGPSETAGAVTLGGTSSGYSVIVAFHGDVYTDMATIVTHLAYQSGINSDILTAAFEWADAAAAVDDCLLVGFGSKSKDADSDGATIAPPSNLPNEIYEFVEDGAFGVADGVAYVQQTTAQDLTADQWTVSLPDSRAYKSVILALRTAAISVPFIKPHAQRSIRRTGRFM